MNKAEENQKGSGRHHQRNKEVRESGLDGSRAKPNSNDACNGCQDTTKSLKDNNAPFTSDSLSDFTF